MTKLYHPTVLKAVCALMCTLAGKVRAEETATPRLAGKALGLRPALESHGFQANLDYTADGFSNISGGLERGQSYKGIAVLSLDGDLEKALGFKGATLHADVYQIHGDNLSDRFTGDLGPLSNIFATNGTRLSEAWVDFSAGNLSIKAGQIGIDGDFNSLESEGVFCNGIFGAASAILLNVPAPGYPIATTGARVRYNFSPDLYGQVALCDGNPARDALGDPSPDYVPGTDFNSSGLHAHWSSSEGALVVAEIGSEATETRKAKWCAGFFYHTDTFSDLAHDSQGRSLADPESDGVPRAIDGNHGVFFAAESQLFASEGKGPWVFGNVALMPSDRNALPFVWRAGFSWTGFLKTRPDDTLGLAVAGMETGGALQDLVRQSNRFNDTLNALPDGEHVVELTWQAPVTKNWILQPDVQWILHPGGSADIDDALVVGLRSVVSF